MSALARGLTPDSAIGDVAHRFSMAASLPALSRRRERAARAIAAALRDTALGTIPPEERAWIDLIEANRHRLAAGLDSPEAVPWMSLPPAWGRFLIRLVRELAPGSCLELGTGFGVSTAYQAAALELHDSGRLASFDVEDMLAIAEPGLERVGLANRVELIGGMIEETLPNRVGGLAPIDFALVDHDHTERGTVAALDAILPFLAADAVVVFDDIHWTEEMDRAWSAVAGDARVGASFDLRRLGIVVVPRAGPAP